MNKSLDEEIYTCLLLCAWHEQDDLLKEGAVVIGNLEKYPGNGPQILEGVYAWVGKVHAWWDEYSEPPDEDDLLRRNPNYETDDDMGE